MGDFDSIYISHIHPDHYCYESLKLFFDHYGEKKILIADWGKKINYLEKIIKSDGLGHLLEITNKKIIGDTDIRIIPNDTGSISDIDSALLVTSINKKKSVLNINDCIYNKVHFDKLKNLQEELSTEITLFCLGYTGAGPYPQTYFSPVLQKDLLNEKAKIKKKNFFESYKKAINLIKSKKRLPFAGKYVLNGDLSTLNKYRGISDALEVKNIDKDAIVLNDGGNEFFDLENLIVSKERDNLYQLPEKIMGKYISGEKQFHSYTLKVF